MGSSLPCRPSATLLLVLSFPTIAACGGSSANSDTQAFDASAASSDAEAFDASAASSDAEAFDASAASSDAEAFDASAASPDAEDAGDAGASPDAEDAAVARDCIVVTGYACAVAGHPYPARCDQNAQVIVDAGNSGLGCCCTTP